MRKTLVIADCPDWAIASLVRPLKKIADTAYHYINTSKGTGTGEKNPVHLTIPLLRNYDQIHFTTARAVDSMLRNPEVLEAVKGKRLIMTIHTEREADLQMIKQSHWKRIDQYISPTRYQQDKIKEYIGKESVYIPLAIDEKKYSYTEDYPRKTNIVGYVGRVMPHKRLKSIVEDSKGYQVVGIGYVDNEGHDYWQSIPKDNLTMYQNLSEDEKIELMRSFTVLVSISEPHIEVGPLGVLEAAALGIPIITTNVGWARDNLRDLQSGYFCQHFTTDEKYDLQEDIKHLMSDRKIQETLRIKARQVIDNWTLEKYIEAHEKLYNCI